LVDNNQYSSTLFILLLINIILEEKIMSQGDKSSYTDKQKRQAQHIEESYEKRGTPKKEAEKRAWATVNKETGGGLKKKSSQKK
jgi:hypothetical protein